MASLFFVSVHICVGLFWQSVCMYMRNTICPCHDMWPQQKGAMCVHTHTGTHTHTHTRTRTRIRCVYTHIHTHARTNKHSHTLKYTYTHTYTHTYPPWHIDTHKHTHAYKNAHLRAQRTCDWPVSWCMAATAKGDVSPMCGGGYVKGKRSLQRKRENERACENASKRQRQRKKEREKMHVRLFACIFVFVCVCVCLPCHAAWPLLQRATFLLFVYVCVCMAVCECVWDRNHCLHEVIELMEPKMGGLGEGASKG